MRVLFLVWYTVHEYINPDFDLNDLIMCIRVNLFSFVNSILGDS